MADGQAIEAKSAAEAFAEAQDHLAAQRWAEAAELLADLAAHNESAALQLSICRNLAALQQHRPQVYHALITSQTQSRYSLGASASGHPTIFYRIDAGDLLSLSPGNKPVAALSATFASIKQSYQAGHAMALLGIGDGYLIKSCALHPPRLNLGGEQAVYLFEPDEQALLACLTIHDYSGPDGPIEQPRFSWFVGPGWIEQAREVFVDEPYNPPPLFQVTQTATPAPVHAAVKELLDSLFPEYERARLDAALHYSAVTASDLAALFGPTPPRRPRVLLITTRRSTVIQYSTRDAAEGFAQLGWDARVVIEPQPHHFVTPLKLARELCDWKPDLVFQIDHVRQEWAELIPRQLPFVCWIQDNLPHLASQEFGRTTGRRDFILCGLPAMYEQRHGYPRRQLLKQPKLTRAAVVSPAYSPVDRTRYDADLVYVSTASATPEQRTREILGAGHCAEATALLEWCCRRMIELYAAEQSLPTADSIGTLLDDAQLATGYTAGSPQVRRQMLETLFDHLNNPLYRQQSLRWAARIADRHGLKLAIYGKGWDANPEFSRHARGPIAYGRDLEELTRAARFNLVLEPTLSISYQRLLDALAAGGFCLIRHCPANTLFQEILNFLVRHVPAQASTVAAVRAALPPEQSAEFESLLARFDHDYASHGDCVEWIRSLQESRILLPRDAMMPHLADVTFDSEAELEQRILTAAFDEPRRRQVAAEQRADIVDRFSYAAGMRRALDWITGLLKTEV
jgi:hypothetical protein